MIICLHIYLYYLLAPTITIKRCTYKLIVAIMFAGFGLRCFSLGPDVILLISYPGELFMRILKLIILPLIISSLVAGSASLNAKMNGK